MLKLRYDVFGAEVLGNAKLVGKYEFPCTTGVRLSSAPRKFLPFDRMADVHPGDWIHFYVHDRRFHNFLACRNRYMQRLRNIEGFIGCDNSMYRDLPLAEQIHSCYLNRAIDYYLQTQNKIVVPNVSWGDWRSYEFCFDGIPCRSTVAVSTYGCSRSRCDRSHFEDGFVMMMERLRPYSVMLHGAMWMELRELCDYHHARLLKIPTQREIANARRKEVCHG